MGPSPKKEMGPLKLVIGIVRPEKTNDVLEALYRAEVRGISMSRVQGRRAKLAMNASKKSSRARWRARPQGLLTGVRGSWPRSFILASQR